MKKVVPLLAVVLLAFGGWRLFYGDKPRPLRTPAAGEIDSEEGGAARGGGPLGDPSSDDSTRPAGAASRNRLESRNTTAPLHAEDGAAPVAMAPPPDLAPPPPRIAVVAPPADSPDPRDTVARLNAETYKTVVTTLRLEPDQEDKFRQILYDAQKAYLQTLEQAQKNPAGGGNPELQAAALEQQQAAQEAARENQKLIANTALKDLLGEQRFTLYSTLVPDPLQLAQGLRFKANEPPPQ